MQRQNPPKKIAFGDSGIPSANFFPDPCAHGVRSLGRNVTPSKTLLTLVEDPKKYFYSHRRRIIEYIAFNKLLYSMLKPGIIHHPVEGEEE